MNTVQAWGKLDRSHPDPATAPRLNLVAVPGDQFGHTRVVAALLGFAPAFEAHRQAIGLDEIARWCGSEDEREPVLDLWLAAVSHHGLKRGPVQ